jgi:hexosaminidase
MTTPALVPLPVSMQAGAGAPFVLSATSAIVSPAQGEARQVADGLAELLRPATGFPMPVVTDAPAGAASITLAVDAARAALGDEGYELVADSGGVRLTAPRPAGLFRGVQTIRQLLPASIESDMRAGRGPWQLAATTIVDAPRFPWRGAMLDVSRHFFTVREVEQFIDLLALYKMNVLHLHLSDDQGWRIEIRSRPRLAEIGGASQVGGRTGGYYTQQDYAAIVRYAQARYITVVPEIDMPGHTNAALSAYPALSCSTRPAGRYTGTEVGWSTFCVEKEETYALVEDVVRELAAITPGPWIHIGGDEVEALTPAQYAAFVERVQGIVARHGKRVAGWEEIAGARLAAGTVVQHWRRDSVVRAIPMGAKVVMSPASRAYLDMKYAPDTELGLRWAGFVGVRTAYDWNPATQVAGVGERDVLGVEAPIWTETLRNISAVHYLAVPRLPALAEVGWTPQERRDWTGLRERLATHAPRWRFLGINYHPSVEIPW